MLLVGEAGDAVDGDGGRLPLARVAGQLALLLLAPLRRRQLARQVAVAVRLPWCAPLPLSMQAGNQSRKPLNDWLCELLCLGWSSTRKLYPSKCCSMLFFEQGR